MNIARILYPVEVLGPGKRVGIWFAGCPRRCRGCSNPELWEKSPRYEIALDDLVRAVESIAAKYPVEGFTFTGGDPMWQYEDCLALAERLSPISKDILVYTGYLFEELPPLSEGIAAIIDGPYLEEENRLSPLKGSENQRLWILNEALRPRYEAYLSSDEGGIQNFHSGSGHISVGIHRPHFLKPSQKEGDKNTPK